MKGDMFMKTNSILVVDDDPSIRKFVRANLEARDYRVLLAVDGDDAIRTIEQELPDLIILDIMMPRVNGLEVCQRVREWSDIPIIMLSARDNEDDKVRCLDCGADDYLTKPFSLKELLSRIKAVLRRYQENSKSNTARYKTGDLEVDFNRHIVTNHGAEINLTATEYKILSYLAINAGKVITPNQILGEVWGDQYLGDFRLLQVNICRLRKKLNDNSKEPRYIITKPGIGYTLQPN